MKILSKKLRHDANSLKLRQDLFFTKHKFRNIVRKKKSSYKLSIIEKMHGVKSKNVKMFWKLLNKLTLDTSRQNVESSISTKEWMDHYNTLLQGSTKIRNNFPKNDPQEGPLDFCITMEEMINASYILKAGKAPGIDNINNEMISTGLTYYPEIFLHIFNTILENGGGIPSWSISLIVPIHKKGPEDDPDNYRGIALISCLAKFF